jgi:hypothetical protein
LHARVMQCVLRLRERFARRCLRRRARLHARRSLPSRQLRWRSRLVPFAWTVLRARAMRRADRTVRYPAV